MTTPARVLVVEDDVDTLNMWQHILSSWGYDVDGAHSAPSALAKIQDKCPDVIISDLVLPGMSGIELLKRLRSTKPDCRIFFVLATGQACVSSAVAAIAEGAAEVLLKPVNFEELHETLKRYGFCGMADD